MDIDADGRLCQWGVFSKNSGVEGGSFGNYGHKRTKFSQFHISTFKRICSLLIRASFPEKND